jgi:hypothetical protein
VLLFKCLHFKEFACRSITVATLASFCVDKNILNIREAPFCALQLNTLFLPWVEGGFRPCNTKCDLNRRHVYRTKGRKDRRFYACFNRDAFYEAKNELLLYLTRPDQGHSSHRCFKLLDNHSDKDLQDTESF